MTVATDLRGRQLQGGKYQLIELVAEGGMATVWSARMTALDTTVAVKVLSPRLSNSPEFRQQFRAEAHLIAELHDPNIIEVYDCEEEPDGLLFIAMRYVGGGSLAGFLSHLDGPMDLSLAAKLTSQLASALQAAHAQGLIHRDVKPANVLLGRADWPLLSDFGIAGAGTQEEGEGRHISGTPSYMSPEQWQGLPLNGASDQYSLAVVFYQLVTRQYPIQAATADELRSLAISAPPKRPREINPGIPGPVEEVMLRALAKRPEDRFDSMTDFATALVESVERSRGMQLETKQALVDSAVGVGAVLGLSILTPTLVGIANPDLPVFNYLTLNWPIRVLVALVQLALLFGIRWQLIGLLSRALGGVLDALDRVTRMYARLGTDPRGPLNVQTWRNSVVGSAEHIIGIIYVVVIYGLIGVPLIKTISEAWNFTAEELVATVVAALVLVLIGANLIAMWRVSGAVMGTVALALCWVFIGGIPIVDPTGWGGISLQWVAKLVIGLAVVGALLSLRERIQRSVGTALGPLLESALTQSHFGFSAQQAGAERQDVQRWSDGIVNVAYLLVTFPIVAVPVRNLLEPVVGPVTSAVIVTVIGIVLVVAMVESLRRAQGFVLAIVGLFLCAPMLLGLPLWESGAVGAGLQWVVRCLIGLGILALLIGLRGRAQRAARAVLVPVLDRQISAFSAPKTEAAAEARFHLLERVSDGLIDVLYVLCAFVAVVQPLAGALADSNLSWLSTVVYLAFVALAAWLLYRVWRHAGAAGLGTASGDAIPDLEVAAAPAA